MSTKNIYSFRASVSTAALLFTFFCAEFAHSAAAPKSSSESSNKAVNVYFSHADEHGRPNQERINSFDCDDKIYAVVETLTVIKGKHQVAVKWVDPSGTTREHTKYPFTVRENPTRIWAWLSLSRATGAGMMQWVNPAAGMDDFIGPWSAQVRIDGKLVAEKGFEVNC